MTDVRSYEAALSDQTKIIRLETEKKALEEKIAALEKLIAEYEVEEVEEEEEETATPLSENGGAPAWINQILSIGAPLLDKHFELKQKALEIEEKRIAQTIAPPAPEIQDTAINTMFAVLKSWIYSIPDSEMQEQIKKMYSDAETLDEFFDELDESYPDLFDDLKEKLSAAKR
jgi:hypothetical protein